MEIDRVHPQLREMAERAPQVDVSRPVTRALARLGSRYLLRPASVPGVRAREVRDGRVRARLCRPDAPSGAGLLWIHGGGMVIGAPRQDDRFCARTAAETGITVLSVDYRLAPEHPSPAPQRDCLAALRWLAAHRRDLGVDLGRVVVAGASAGGGLAASVVNTLHDTGELRPAGQLLVYPMLDDRTAADTRLDAVRHLVWDNRANRFGWSSLLRGIAEPGAPDVPAEAAPARRVDFTGLPPTWLGVGDIDLFHREGLAYAEALARAGVDVTVDVVPGAPHGFESLAPDAPVVRDFVAGARSWLRETVGT